MNTGIVEPPDSDGVPEFPFPGSSQASLDLQPPRPEHFRPAGVLVVEDEPLMLKAMEQGLRKKGFRVWTADDGGQAIEVFRQFGAQIDIVLSDVQMPVLDGPQALEALRVIRPSIRICFMTADARLSTTARLLSRGALRVFAKPLSSVAEVAEELWGLATCPESLSSARREVGGDEKLRSRRGTDAFRSER